MPGKEAGEFVVKILLGDAGDAPEPGGGASLGATPPGGGGITFRPPPPKRTRYNWIGILTAITFYYF